MASHLKPAFMNCKGTFHLTKPVDVNKCGAVSIELSELQQVPKDNASAILRYVRGFQTSRKVLVPKVSEERQHQDEMHHVADESLPSWFRSTALRNHKNANEAAQRQNVAHKQMVSLMHKLDIDVEPPPPKSIITRYPVDSVRYRTYQGTCSRVISRTELSSPLLIALQDADQRAHVTADKMNNVIKLMMDTINGSEPSDGGHDEETLSDEEDFAKREESENAENQITKQMNTKPERHNESKREQRFRKMEAKFERLEAVINEMKVKCCESTVDTQRSQPRVNDYSEDDDIDEQSLSLLPNQIIDSDFEKGIGSNSTPKSHEFQQMEAIEESHETTESQLIEMHADRLKEEYYQLTRASGILGQKQMDLEKDKGAVARELYEMEKGMSDMSLATEESKVTSPGENLINQWQRMMSQNM